MMKLTHRPGTTDHRDVREVAGYRHSRLVEFALVYFHGSLDPELVPTSELVIRRRALDYAGHS